MQNQSWQNLLKFLEEIAARLRQLELEAADSLHRHGDREGYERLQREKTELLISLPERADSLLSPLPPELWSMVANGLEDFATEARRAKKVNSIFYMSVLLYPDDDHGPHAANAFDVLVDEIVNNAILSA